MRLSFKEKRNKVGMTQRELGIAVGLAEISIRKLENGERETLV